MKAVLALVALLLVTACGSDGDPVAVDPGSAGGPGPAAIPAAPGTVRTRTVATVMDTGSPELCLGPVAESWPPQCSGPPIDGWDWSQHEGTYQKSGAVRWGRLEVSGTWDGRSSFPRMTTRCRSTTVIRA